MVLVSYPLALLLGYLLFVQNYLGVVALIGLTIVAIKAPHQLFNSMIGVLVLGTFNLLSFIYLFDMVMAFELTLNLSEEVPIRSPGIQVFSLVLLIILARKRKAQVKELIRNVLDRTEEDEQRQYESSKSSFKRKFDRLSDSELERRLQDDLVPEAIAAAD